VTKIIATPAQAVKKARKWVKLMNDEGKVEVDEWENGEIWTCIPNDGGALLDTTVHLIPINAIGLNNEQFNIT